MDELGGKMPIDAIKCENEAARRSFFTEASAFAFIAYAEKILRRPAFLPDSTNNSEFFALSIASTKALLDTTTISGLYEGHGFEIGAGYVDASTPNAFAAWHDETAIIGLHVGLMVSIYEFALFAFSQHNSFQELAKASTSSDMEMELGHMPGFWSREIGASLSPQAYIKRMSSSFPVDPARYLLALFLAHSMARFAWFHEYFHVVNGHVGWLRACRDSTGVIEITEESQPLLTLPDRALHALELDADRSAFNALCRLQMSNLENIAAFGSLPHKHRMTLTLFAAYAMTWLFEEYLQRNRVLITRHPSPYVRLHNLLRTLASNVAIDLADAALLNRLALSGFGSLRPLVMSMPLPANVLSDFGNAEIQDELDRSESELEKLRGEFRIYAPIG